MGKHDVTDKPVGDVFGKRKEGGAVTVDVQGFRVICKIQNIRV